jgi:hypothetical protein
MTLSQVFHHHISFYGDVFWVCAVVVVVVVVVTQLTVENGEPLFKVK